MTLDKGIRFQQNLASLTRGTSLGIVSLSAKSNRLRDLVPLLPLLHEALAQLKPSEAVVVALPERSAT